MKLIPDPANQLAPHNKSNWLWTAEGLCWSAAEEIFHTALCLSTVTLPGKARGGEKTTASLSQGRRTGDLAQTI